MSAPTPPDISLEGCPPVANLHHYFGLWAVEPTAFFAAWERAASIDLSAHIRAQAGTGRPFRTEPGRAGELAVIEARGPLMKTLGSLEEGTSTIALRRQFRFAAQDPGIEGVLFVVDSPGGTADGTGDLADEIARTAKAKPVYAFVEDLVASAAYHAASQATKIYANQRSAKIGSIGTFIGLYDLSGAAAAAGIRPVVISSGGVKAAGFPGTEITDEQVQHWQGLVDDTQSEFSAAVRRGRGLALETVRGLADGRIYMAPRARELGLIDEIDTFENTMAALKRAARQQAKAKQEAKMAEERTPATFEELKLFCVGADADFLCAQLERKATVDQATSAWMEEQNRRLAAAEARRQAAEEKAAAPAPAARIGIEPIGSPTAKAAEEVEDPRAEWNAEIARRLAAGMSRREAASQLARDRPELREALVAAAN